MKEDIGKQQLDFSKKMSPRGNNLKTSRHITMNRFDCSEAFPLPPNIPERPFSQYSTMKQFHVGSSIETVGLRLEKARGLQQNPARFCFKIPALVFWSRLFHKVDLTPQR
jgi:hypothetical protein